MCGPELPAPLPAKRPCGSCPYRCDVPSGVWSAEDYAKLPPYDGETMEQPQRMFNCHQRDGRLCAGWVATHDMENSLAVRFAAMTGTLDGDQIEALFDYTTDVPLFSSGTEAARHGMADIDDPGDEAVALMRKVGRLPGVEGGDRLGVGPSRSGQRDDDDPYADL